MDLLDKIKNYFLHYTGMNVLCRFDENESNYIEQVRNLLKNDYGYLDIILTKEDFEQINDLTKDLEITKDFETEFELHACILKKVSPDIDSDFTNIDMMLRTIRDESRKRNRIPRLHVVLDDIDDNIIQAKVNDLIASRTITVICYASKEPLHYMTSCYDFLQKTHDYLYVESNLMRQNNERRRKNDKH